MFNIASLKIVNFTDYQYRESKLFFKNLSITSGSDLELLDSLLQSG
jgi:hypothetical protein